MQNFANKKQVRIVFGFKCYVICKTNIYQVVAQLTCLWFTTYLKKYLCMNYFTTELTLWYPNSHCVWLTIKIWYCIILVTYFPHNHHSFIKILPRSLKGMLSCMQFLLTLPSKHSLLVLYSSSSYSTMLRPILNPWALSVQIPWVITRLFWIWALVANWDLNI